MKRMELRAICSSKDMQLIYLINIKIINTIQLFCAYHQR